MKVFKLISLVVLICFSNIAKSQNFIISGMGSFPDISSNATAINFKSTASCIDVQSGIAVLNNTYNIGEFVINCKENQQFNKLGLKLFPIPVVNNAKARFTNTPPLNEIFHLTIWDVEGKMVMSKKETGYQMFQGLLLNLNYLGSGNYIFKIETSQYVDAIKFVKVK
jgi:hypothetical protein